MGSSCDAATPTELGIHGAGNYAHLAINEQHGEVAERLKAPVSKTGILVRVSRVRIPLSPPFYSYYEAPGLR